MACVSKCPHCGKNHLSSWFILCKVESIEASLAEEIRKPNASRFVKWELFKLFIKALFKKLQTREEIDKQKSDEYQAARQKEEEERQTHLEESRHATTGEY